MKPVRFHSAAVDEAEAAARWYRERSRRAAAAFLAELDRAIDFIRDAPERWPTFILGTRRILLRRFPFAVVYRVDDDGPQVIAVAHGKRRPGYWMER